MAKNLLGGTTKKSFARGAPPPPGSWEYVGFGEVGKAGKKSPPVAAPAPGKKIPMVIATMETVAIIERKPKKWRYLSIGAAIGAGLTYLGIKTRSY
jgi:hypothetical protein